MPGLSGIALFEQLQQAAPALAGRILVASGDLSQPDTRVFLQRTGAPALLKPYSNHDLLEALSACAPCRPTSQPPCSPRTRRRDAPPRSPSLLRRPLLISIRFASSRLERLMAARQPITQDAVHADHPLAGGSR